MIKSISLNPKIVNPKIIENTIEFYSYDKDEFFKVLNSLMALEIVNIKSNKYSLAYPHDQTVGMNFANIGIFDDIKFSNDELYILPSKNYYFQDHLYFDNYYYYKVHMYNQKLNHR